MIADQRDIALNPATLEPRTLLSIDQVCEIVRPFEKKPVTKQSVYRWIREGSCGRRKRAKVKLQAVQLPGCMAVRYSDLQDFLAALQPGYERTLTEDEGIALMRSRRGKDARVQGGGVAVGARTPAAG